MDTFATICREAVGTLQVLLWTTILSNYDLMQFYLLLSHYSSPKQVVLWETFWRLILQSQGLKVDNCNASMHFLLNYEQQLCFIRCAHCGKKYFFVQKFKKKIFFNLIISALKFKYLGQYFLTKIVILPQFA